MSNEPVIRVENLGKCYQIYERPADRLKQSVFRGRRKYFHEFWALQDVSIRIRKNETVGIIGANGSGKSTLLQVICGILRPTTGSVSVTGRVAALLELGSGFNPEFTGRENIRINAAIMGLTPEEIDARFDEVLQFANIGKFINQPVKCYSSGMYVRLAFAVAINVSPDILVVDEALAVGDARFRMKCMAKIREFCENGTVIFVSHDMAAVKDLCTRVIWIDRGHIQLDGDPKEVVDRHLAFMYEGLPEAGDLKSEDRPTPRQTFRMEGFTKVGSDVANFGDKRVMVIGVRIQSHKGESNIVYAGQACHIDILLHAHEQIDLPIVGYMVRDRLGREIVADNSSLMESELSPFFKEKKYLVSFHVNDWPNLNEGDYSLVVAVADGSQDQHVQCHLLQDVLIFKSVQVRKPGALMSVLDARVSVNEMEG